MSTLPRSWTIIEYPSIDSTNTEAARLVRERGLAPGSIVTAREQTAGRGTHGKKWTSSPGNFHGTFVFTLTSLQAVHQLSFLTALAVAEGLQAALGEIALPIQFKWPNDLFVRGAKAGGILVETQSHEGKVFVLAGVGINLVHHPDIPPDQGHEATSLLKETGVRLLPDDITGFISQRLATWLRQWQQRGFEPVREQWLKSAIGVGQSVTVKTGDREEKGIYLGIDDEGALLMSSSHDKTRKTFRAGIAHLQMRS